MFTRKLGPLPVWAWLVIVAVVGYVLYRRYASNLSGAQAQSQQVSSASSQGAATPTDLGLTPSQAGASGSSGSSTPDTSTSDIVTALGGQQAALFQAIEAANQDVLSLAASQITAAQNGGLGSATNMTQPVTSPQPGGSYAPTFNYYAPSVASSPSNTKPAAASAPAKQPTRYYTYRSSVPLATDQSVHFTKGKGYYAA